MNKYYQKEMQCHVGCALGLDSKLLLEGLTDNLPKTVKQLVAMNSSKINIYITMTFFVCLFHVQQHV